MLPVGCLYSLLDGGVVRAQACLCTSPLSDLSKLLKSGTLNVRVVPAFSGSFSRGRIAELTRGVGCSMLSSLFFTAELLSLCRGTSSLSSDGCRSSGCLVLLSRMPSGDGVRERCLKAGYTVCEVTKCSFRSRLYLLLWEDVFLSWGCTWFSR